MRDPRKPLWTSAALLCFIGLCISVTPLSCGSSKGADQCTAACQAPSQGPCAGRDSTDCIAECEAAIEGTSDLCALCIVKQTEWVGIECVCHGGTCCQCKAGTDGQVCGHSAPYCPCTPADDKCNSYHVGRSTDSACKNDCAQ
jgi:hypothetical protein